MQFRVLSFLALLAVLVAASPVPQPQIEERAPVPDTAHGHKEKVKAVVAKAKEGGAAGVAKAKEDAAAASKANTALSLPGGY